MLKRIQFRIVSSCYLQNLKVRQLPKHELKHFFEECLPKNKNYFCVLALYDAFVRSRRFVKTFCQAGEAVVQDYAHAQSIFTEIFLHTSYYYYYAEISDVLVCCINYVFYKLYYLFGRNADKIQVM